MQVSGLQRSSFGATTTGPALHVSAARNSSPKSVTLENTSQTGKHENCLRSFPRTDDRETLKSLGDAERTSDLSWHAQNCFPPWPPRQDKRLLPGTETPFQTATSLCNFSQAHVETLFKWCFACASATKTRQTLSDAKACAFATSA